MAKDASALATATAVASTDHGGLLVDDPALVILLRDLVALHYARSYAVLSKMEAVREKLSAQTKSQDRDRLSEFYQQALGLIVPSPIAAERALTLSLEEVDRSMGDTRAEQMTRFFDWLIGTSNDQVMLIRAVPVQSFCLATHRRSRWRAASGMPMHLLMIELPCYRLVRSSRWRFWIDQGRWPLPQTWCAS